MYHNFFRSRIISGSNWTIITYFAIIVSILLYQYNHEIMHQMIIFVMGISKLSNDRHASEEHSENSTPNTRTMTRRIPLSSQFANVSYPICMHIDISTLHYSIYVSVHESQNRTQVGYRIGAIGCYYLYASLIFESLFHNCNWNSSNFLRPVHGLSWFQVDLLSKYRRLIQSFDFLLFR